MAYEKTYLKYQKEFNLILFFQYIWRKKWWIVLSTLFFTVASYFYANSVKPEWTTTAEVIPAQVNSVEKLLDLKQRYALISGEKFNSNGVTAELFNQFVTNTSIFDVRKNYFLESELYKTLAKQTEKDKQQDLLIQLIKSITVFTPEINKKGNNITVITTENKAIADVSSAKLSFINNDIQLLQETLDGFIKFTNQITYQQAITDFLIKVKQKITELKHQQKQIEEQLLLKKQEQIQYLQSALATAQLTGNTPKNDSVRLNIELDKGDINLSTPYLYLLGSQNLLAQLTNLKQQKFIYPTDYYQAKQKIVDLAALVNDAEILKIDVFQYKSESSYPYKIKPQKALILVIGFLFGLIFPCLVLLFILVLKKK
ncbi:LPS O-antigen chain length determinant protein WzzB [Gallibacterium trehalosifermentans]|uniref:LPS O-antigen chain length determinant protein WzzB n=1 Tax=Gallibacterium trehalosifermentans TaxID=516935 RepID=A0ABV6GXV7_9PAST